MQPRSFGHPHLPWREPEEANQPESDEERPPAIPPDKHCAEKYSKCRSSGDARGDERIRPPAQRLWKVLCQYLVVRREGGRFARAQDQPHDQQHLKPMHYASRGRGDGPKEKSAGKNPVHIETVHEPP